MIWVRLKSAKESSLLFFVRRRKVATLFNAQNFPAPSVKAILKKRLKRTLEKPYKAIWKLSPRKQIKLINMCTYLSHIDDRLGKRNLSSAGGAL